MLQFSAHLISLLSLVFRCNGVARIQKAVVDQTSNRPPVTMTFFLVQVWLWEVIWSLSVQPLSWSSLVVCETHFSSHVTWSRNGLLLRRIREDDTSKRWCAVSSWGTLSSSFSYLYNLLQMRMTIEWSMLSSLATSCVVIRGSASTILSNGCCQLLTSGHYACHLQGTHLLCKTWITTSLYIC